MNKYRFVAKSLRKKPCRNYPRNKVIAVDVDGTLFSRGKLNQELSEYCRIKKEEGFFMILWSARGQKYTQQAAERADMVDVFDIIIGKPGYIVDDNGWRWVRFTKVVLWPEILDALKFKEAVNKKRGNDNGSK